MCTGKFNAGGKPAMDYNPIQKYSYSLCVMKTRNRHWPDSPLGLDEDITYLPTCTVIIPCEIKSGTITSSPRNVLSRHYCQIMHKTHLHHGF